MMFHRTKVLFLMVGVLFSSSVMASASTGKLKKKLSSAVAKELSPSVRLVIDKVSLRPNIPASAHVSVENPHPPLGVVTFKLSWKQGKRWKTAHTKALVKGFAPVAIARRPIRHGGIFSLENVRFEEREITSHALTGFYTDWESLKGLKAKGYIRPGVFLSGSNTAKPPAVSRGQSVQLTHREGAVRITANVIALELGRLGDWIRVRNPNSNKVFTARVSGLGKASTK